MSPILGRISLGDEAVASLEFAWSAGLEVSAPKRIAQFWKARGVSLGHLVRQPCGEHRGLPQPWAHPSVPVVITADIRLDNADGLKRALSLGADAGMPASDAEVALKAYLKWGDGFVERLYGDFAIAIWDGRSRRLLCARDAFGVKPLHYHHGSAHFSFASNLLDLLQLPSMPNRLDLRYVRTELQAHFNQHPKYTFFEGVRKLEPGHALCVSSTGLRTWRHWRPENLPATRMQSEEDYRTALRDLVVQAVERRLRGAGRTGAHLSGGLDSSAVSVLASRALGGQGFPVFPWAPPPDTQDRPLNDERDSIECLAAREHLHVVYSQPSAEDLLAETARDITRVPSVDFAWEAVVCGTASHRGIETLLSGWGGDEGASFNGRGFYASLLVTGRWWRLLREIHMKAMLHDIPRRALFRNRVLRPLFPESVQRRVSGMPADPRTAPLPAGLTPAFADMLAKAEPYAFPSLTERPGVHRMQRVLLGSGHLAHRMEAWAARGSEYGIEYRYPLLDRRLVEFALTIPDHLFIKQGWKRYLFRRAFEGILPDEILRKKVKSDPAMWRANRALQAAYGGLLARALRERHDRIESAGLVDADKLIAAAETAYRQIADSPSTPIHAAVPPEWQPLSLVWLAFLSPETTVS